MKKLSLFLMMMAFITLGACKKDKDSGESFSGGTPEDHKIAMQKDASEVAKKLDDMQDLKAMVVMEEFMDLMVESNDLYYAIENTLKSAVALKGGANSVFVSGFEDDAFSFNDWYAGETGIFTYNEVTHEWDKKPSSSELKYIFNSKEDGKVVIQVSEFKALGISNPELTPELSDLLTSAKASLTADGEILMTIAFSASYDKDGIPASFEQAIILDEYAMSFKASKSKSSVAFDYSFKYQAENILSAHFDSKGNFDFEEIENAMEIDMDSEEGILQQEVVQSSNVWIALGNFKFDGFANWKNLGEQFPIIDEESEEGMTEVEAKGMAKALDSNVKVYLRYFDSNKVIAKSEFYAKSYDDYDHVYWDFSMAMRFADGSAMDESFLLEGFGGYMAGLAGIFGDIEE